MTSPTNTLLVDQPEEGVTRITLNRPDRLNAMNVELIGDLHDALDDVAHDRSCRVVLLTGAGRGFCAGLDLGGYGPPRARRDWAGSRRASPPRRISPPWCHSCAPCRSR